MPRLLLLTAFLWFPSLAGAQVVHNFEMDPENTDCARLDSLAVSEPQLADSILASTFRLREELQISRYSAPRMLVFASCDGTTGYLLAWQNEKMIHVFTAVSTRVWENIMQAQDPREAYRNAVQTLTRYTMKKAP